MALEIRRLVRDDRVGRGVRLVEGVVCEGVDIVVDRLRGALADPVRDAALDAPARVAVQERAALLFNVLDLFLAHGAAEHIRLPERVAGKLLEDLNDLLLIDDAAVGDRQDRLELRNEVCHLARIVLAGDELRNGVHRAGAVERDKSRDILNVLRLETDAHARHAARFKLKDARSLARGEHFIGLGIVLRDVRQLEAGLRFLHGLDRVVEHRQIAQAEEVHFEQPQLLERRHHILADHRVVVRRQRDVIDHGALGDDHARGVRRGVARHPLKGARRVDELFHLLVVLVLFAQLARELERVVERDVQISRPAGYELGDHIAVGVGHIQRAAHVADRAARRHRAEGHDLRHMVVAVLAADVVHDLAAAGIAEVHVDIGHGHALGIEKALEEKTVLHRLNVRDVQTVAHDAARRAAAPRADGDADALGVAHKVGDDEKIIDEAHLLDHVLLVFQLRLLLFRPLAVAPGKAVRAELFEIGQRGVALRHLEFRQVVLAEGELQIAHLRDLPRVFDRAGVLGEKRLHLLRRAEVEVLRLVAHPVLVVHGLARLDAQQHIVRVGVRLRKIVRVVRAHERQPRLLVDAQQALVYDRLIADAVVLKLKIEAVGAKYLRECQGIRLCIVVLAVAQPAGDLASKTRRERNKSLGVRAQQLKVDAGLDVEALGKRLGDHVGEVAVALLVLAQKDKVARLGVKLVLLVKARAGRDIDLAADDGLDALGLARAVEVDRAVHHAVVGHGDRRLPQLADALGQPLDAARAVKKAVFRMNVQMCKRHDAFLSLCFLFARKLHELAHPVVEAGFCQRRVEGLRQLAERQLRLQKPSDRDLLQLDRQRGDDARIGQARERLDLLARGGDRLVHIRRVAVDAAVDRVAHFLFDLCGHDLHRRGRRADACEQLLNVVALLEIGHAVALPLHVFRLVAHVAQQRLDLAPRLQMRRGKLKMVALERIGHAAARKKGPAQERRAAALLLQQREVDVQRVVLVGIVAERF